MVNFTAMQMGNFSSTLLGKRILVENILKDLNTKYGTPFYSSVDLRRSELRITPVDLNLFPGGFNNLSEAFLQLGAETLSNDEFVGGGKVIVIPENHSRNTFYLQNLKSLTKMLSNSGLEVQIGSFNISEPFQLPNGDFIYPLKSRGNLIYAQLENSLFCPEYVLLNNDLSSGLDQSLANLDFSQSFLVPIHAGWFCRRKSNYFKAYEVVARDFGEKLGIDPWSMIPLYDVLDGIDFKIRNSEELLIEKIHSMFERIQAEHKKRSLVADPFVVVKSDNGTYGMSIMVVKSLDELRSFNRKTRNKMAVGKEGIRTTRVLIQEGIKSLDSCSGYVSEPVVYMIRNRIIGGFYRFNPNRDDKGNLNSKGAGFEMFKSEILDEFSDDFDCFYPYSVISRLSAIAAGLELSNSKECLQRDSCE